MELRHLEFFIAVAEERSFTRGAARVHVVQSAISAGIKALEKELGATLLERSTKRVDLTEAGAALLVEARKTLQAAADARDAVDAVQGGIRGTVRIGTMTSVGIVDLAAILGRFRARHPHVAVQVTAAPSGGSQELVAALEERKVDLALVSMPGGRPASIELVDVAQVPIELLVPSGHELASMGSARLSDLAECDFIDSPIGYGNRTLVDRAFIEAGVSRRVTIEVADVGTISDFVSHGLGIALLPQFAIHPGPSVAVVPLTDTELVWPMSLAVPADRRPSAAAAALIELLRETVADAH